MLHYLILAHRNPKQLEFLIERLYSPYNKIYIQLDKKSNIKDYIHLRDKAQFIKKRVSINRGGFNMIKATLNGFTEILPNMKIDDHIIIMSGQDLPIKSQKHIQDFFAKHKQESFIEFSKDAENKFNTRSHLEKYYFNDITIPSRIDNILNKVVTNFYDIEKKQRQFFGKKESQNSVFERRRQIFSSVLNKRFSFLPAKKYLTTNYTIYGGSQRQAISQAHIQYILDFCNTKEGKQYKKAFKHTNCPDERFFQILLLNSPHKDKIVNKLLRHINWQDGARSPDTLTMSNFEELKKSDKLFARKFDLQTNGDIMEKIDGLCKYKFPKKEAILMLTDKGGDTILERFTQISKYKSEYRDFLIVFHQKQDQIPDEIKEHPHYIFTNKILSELGYTPIAETLLPGSNHFPLLKFYREHPNYQYYWNIENDVYFQGERKDVFDTFKQSDVDFISCHVEEYNDNPRWYWWNTLKHKNKKYPLKKRLKSFNPIYRISNKALAFIDQSLQQGWTGHHEVLIPTLLYNNGYSISDFGGTGKFVPADQKNKFYKKKSMTHIPITIGNTKHRLYHPIKD